MTNNKAFRDLKISNSKRTDRDVLVHALQELYTITGWCRKDIYSKEEKRDKLIELMMELETHLEITREGE